MTACGSRGLGGPLPLAGERDLEEGGRREVLEKVLERFGEGFGRFWKVWSGVGRFGMVLEGFGRFSLIVKFVISVGVTFFRRERDCRQTRGLGVPVPLAGGGLRRSGWGA